MIAVDCFRAMTQTTVALITSILIHFVEDSEFTGATEWLSSSSANFITKSNLLARNLST
jgi:hypothetical protein